MNLYTAMGDKGETSLIDGTRVAKDHVRVTAYGTVDELSCLLGWCRQACDQDISAMLSELQGQIFGLCSELATPPSATPAKWNYTPISQETCRRLEAWIDQAQAAVEPLKHFVLPGGIEAACRLHMARACCRRAERCVVALNHVSPVRPDLLIYLNRLSDLLYAWARLVNHRGGCPEIVWRPNG